WGRGASTGVEEFGTPSQKKGPAPCGGTRSTPANASVAKGFGREFYGPAFRLMLEVRGAAGAIKRGSPEAILRGRVERAYRGTLILTFGGGTNEIQRDLISVFGLGMQVRR